MIRLVYSNRTEELRSELGERLRLQQERDGAIIPVRVVVPSANVERYVRLGVARAHGIAANIECTRLTRFAADLVTGASGERIADATAIAAMALSIFLDDATLVHPDFAGVRAYILGGGEENDAMDARRVQLASRVGRLFEEYTYSRGELLESWRRGPSLGPERAQTEVWQRRLWVDIFGEGGLTERRAASGSPRIVPLHEAVAALDPDACALPTAVHVFAFSHIARGFHAMIERIARASEIFIYALSPCEGFWEDADASDPDALRLWGRPGREQVRALNAIARFDHDDRFVDP
ncbi:MAG: exodeoxyribonuclease V subunit gamma, partial [Polyangiaceae bacterium]